MFVIQKKQGVITFVPKIIYPGNAHEFIELKRMDFSSPTKNNDWKSWFMCGNVPKGCRLRRVYDAGR